MKKTFEFYKKTIIRAILFALIISVMVIIFVLSAQDGRDSGGTSGGLTELLLAIVGIDAGSLTEAEFTKTEAFVRTAAHFSEYALLAFLAVFLLATYKIKRIFSLLFAVAFSSLYAVTDEIHQIFVPGRAAEISDWLVDTCGALTGAALAVLVIAIAKKIAQKRKSRRKRNNGKIAKKKKG